MSEEHSGHGSNRPDSNSTSMNRRSMLKSLGATGTASSFLVGASSVSAEPNREASLEELTAARTSDEVQSLLDELGDPEVNSSGAEATSAALRGNPFTIVRLPTSVGEVIYSESGNNAAAQYHFKTDRTEENIPAKYRDIPEDSTASLVSNDDGVVFRRTATEREQRELARLTNTDINDTVAVTSSEYDGFKVVSSGGESVVTHHVDLQTREVSTTEKDASISGSSTFDLEATDSTDWCWRCVQSIGVCAGCNATCGGSIGSIGCAACVLTTCGAGGYACYMCAIQCGCG